MNDFVKKLSKLLEKARLLPMGPGCYLMKNKAQQIIYVGKAINLKNRVSSYFNQSLKSPKTDVLVSHIFDFDFMMTENDAESFVLENNLIKKHTPKYNIRLKDDKSYPYVVINNNEPFARLEYVRKVKRGKGIEVYGPFVSGSNVSEVLKMLTKNFTLRDCSLSEFKKRKEPCLLFQLKSCQAPCVGLVSPEEYENNLVLVRDVFLKNGNKAIRELEKRMRLCADGEEFEKAAMLRDDLRILYNFVNHFKQNLAEIDFDKNIDIVAFYEGSEEIDLSIYMIRNKILLGHKNFNFYNFNIQERVEDLISSYLFQYYSKTYDLLPDLIVTQMSNEVNQLLEYGIASLEKEKTIKVGPPAKKFNALLDLTREHAFEQQRVRMLSEDSVLSGLDKLKDLLELKERPVVLECFDVAVFQGKSPTASQIVFHQGKPDRKNYRHYHLKELPEGNNDFAMMKELILRRIDNGQLPDVFIVDGGKGQVHIFSEVLKALNYPIPVVGIAKSKVIRSKDGFKNEEIKRGEERLIIEGRMNPYVLRQNKSLFKIMVQMRDEAHRFARRLHHKKEIKRVLNKTGKKENE